VRSETREAGSQRPAILRIPAIALILALFLGPMMEMTLRQSLFMARGEVWQIIARPIPIVLYSMAVAVIVLPFLYRMVKKQSKTRRHS